MMWRAKKPLRSAEMTKLFLSMVAALVLAATGASAQLVDLSGRYRCVQQCRDEQPAFVAQNGRELNLLNEAGEPSRAWIDWPGHIWVHRFQEGAVYSPDGMVIQFDRGTVWQRELEPEAAPARRTRSKTAARGAPVAPRAAPPRRTGAPAEAVAPPAPRATPLTARKAAPAPRTAAVPLTAFDGAWSVVINTHSGPCDPQYRFGVQIVDGNIIHDGGGVANVQGEVAPNGSVWVHVSAGAQAASGQGRLTRDSGTGSWSGQGSAGTCVGSWQAVRRG
jgi:hypothetical protein